MRMANPILICLGLLALAMPATHADPPIITPEQDTLASLSSLRICLETYRIDNRVYPSEKQGFEANGFLKDQFWPIYIRQFPSVDGWDQFWSYQSDGQSYLLISAGEDGELNADYDLNGNLEPAGDDILVIDKELLADPHLLARLQTLELHRQKNPWAAR